MITQEIIMIDPYYKREYNLNVVDWTEAFLNYDKSVHLNKEIKNNRPYS